MATWLNGNAGAFRVEDINGKLVDVLPGGTVLSYSDLTADGFTYQGGAVVFETGDRVGCFAVVTGAVSGNGVLVVPVESKAKGRYVQKIITNPTGGGDAPTAYTVVVTDAQGAELFTVPERSTTDTERYDVPAGISKDEILDSDWTLTVTGMGDGNIVSVTVIFD